MRVCTLILFAIFTCCRLYSNIQWAPPEKLPFSGDVSFSDVGVTPSGKVIVVANVLSGTNVIEARIYNPSTGSWSSPVPISDPGNIPGAPVLKVDGKGNALVLWAQEQSSSYLVFASYFDGLDWSFPQSISEPMDEDTDPKFGFDSEGNAISIWKSIHSGGESIETAIFHEQTLSWSNPFYLFTSSSKIYGADFSIDAADNVSAIWGIDSSPSDLAFALYSGITKAWSAPQLFPGIKTSRFNSHLSLGNNGEGVASWLTDIGGGTRVLQVVNMNILKRNFSIPIGIGSFPDEQQFDQRIQILPSGDAILIWQQPNSISPTEDVINVIRYNPQTGEIYSPTTLTNTLRQKTYLQLKGDSQGNLIAVWSKMDGMREVQASYFSHNMKKWLSPSNLKSDSSIKKEIQLGVNRLGHAAVTWIEDKTLQYVIGAIIPPPNSVQVKQFSNRFPFQTEYYNVLTWKGDPTAERYKIFKNGKLLAVVPASQLSYEDHNVPKRAKDTYSIIAESRLGVQSSSVQVKIR